MKHGLKLDPEVFREHYPDKPFRVKHNLHEHPLMNFKKMVEVAQKLPPELIDYFTGKVGVNEDKTKTAPTGLTPEETIQKIQDAESWLVLKRVDLIDEFKELVQSCLTPLSPLVEQTTPGMKNFGGWIFCTSPQSISPYHLDPEHNFLLQVKGQKIVHVFDQNDRDLITEEELERWHDSGETAYKLEYRDEFQKKAKTYVLEPGDGVFIPVDAPHWVKVEDDVSMTISLTYYTPEIEYRAKLYKMNAMLRRMGINPTPPGNRPVVDRTKWALISGYRGVKSIFGAK